MNKVDRNIFLSAMYENFHQNNASSKVIANVLGDTIRHNVKTVTAKYNAANAYGSLSKHRAESDAQYDTACVFLEDAKNIYNAEKELLFDDISSIINTFEQDYGMADSHLIANQETLGDFYDDYVEHNEDKNDSFVKHREVPDSFNEIYNSVENGVSNPDFDFDEHD